MRAAILEATTARQSDVTVAASRWYVRGGRLCYIASATGETLLWVYEDGERETGSADDFRARALDEVAFGPGRAASYLDATWQVASARGVSPTTRQMTLGRAMQRAPTQAEASEVARWVLALAAGREPERRTT